MKARCLVCGAVASLDLLVAHDDARAALLAAFGISEAMGAALLRYLGLWRPAERELSLRRVAVLLGELLPALHAQRIERDRREWPAPPPLWIAAIDQMLSLRQQGKLHLPLTSHGYLFEVMAQLADRAGADEERQREAERQQRARTPQQSTYTVRGVPMPAHQAFAAAFGGRDPALLKIEADSLAATRPDAATRARLAELSGRTPPPRAPADADTEPP